MIGETISHYTIIEKVGEGGMGIVYRARDVNLDRIVAIKVLPGHLSSDAEATKRFIHEARAASALDHPNIGTIYEIDTTGDGVTFIAMAYYDGGTLRERIDSGEIPVDETRNICSKIASGLDKAHSSGIVHRDIKPSNILFSTDGEVKIVDFGLAKLEGRTRLTMQGTTLGTAAYMSPEQAQGLETDGRSDIFSLGVILYEMLAGRLPFRGEHEAALLYGIVHEKHEALPEPVVTEWKDADSAVAMALVKDREARYSSAAEMKLAIENEAPARSSPRRGTSANSRSRLAVVIMMVAALSVLAVLTGRKLLDSPDSEKTEIDRTSPVPWTPLPSWILLSDFEGPENDPAVARVVRGMIESALIESGVVTPLSNENIREGLRKAMMPDTIVVSGDVARELAYRAGAEAYVEGSVDKVFGGYAVHVNVLEAETGNILFSIHESSENDTGMFSAMERIGDSLLVHLGTRQEDLERRRIGPDVKYASMEVYKLFEETVNLHGRINYDTALERLDEIIRLDPDFAPAWLQKGIIYSNRHEVLEAVYALTEAEKRLDRLTDAQQLFLRYMLKDFENEEVEAIEITKEYSRKYGGYTPLAALYHELGRFEESYEATVLAVDRAPFGPSNITLSNKAEIEITLGKMDEADTTIDMIGREINRADLRGVWLVAQSRWESADSAYREDFLEDWGPAFEMEIAKGAVSKSGLYIDAVPGYDLLYNFAFSNWHILYIFGVQPDLSVISECSEEKIRCLLFKGYTAAGEGRTAEAERLLSAIEEKPQVLRDFFATDIVLLRAWIKHARGDYQGSIDMLTPHVAGGRMPKFAGTLPVRWLRAESLVASGRLKEAITAFEHVISPLRLSKKHDYYARAAYVSQAHRRLALLHSRLGNTDKAREHLAAFEAMFTDPDPELMPLLEEVRAAVNGMN